MHLTLLFLLLGWTPAVEAEREATVAVGDAMLAPLLSLPEPLQEALAAGEHAAAVAGLQAIDLSALHGHEVSDHAFLLAWSLVRAGKAEEAAPLMPKLQAADHVPLAYLQLVAGEVMLATGDPVDAAALLESIPDDTPITTRARLAAAAAHKKAGATARSSEILEALVARPPRTPGNAEALLVLVDKLGEDNPAAVTHLRALWSHHPQTEGGRRSLPALARHERRDPTIKPTDAHVAARASALMWDASWRDAVVFLEPRLGRFPNGAATSPASCEAWYVYGRSQYKRNNLTVGLRVMEPGAVACVGVSDDHAAKLHYLAGKALDRKKAYAQSAAIYAELPRRIPTHSMADDGHALAGIALQVLGRHEEAAAEWNAQVAAYPDGDMAGETGWRLAWTHYLEGNTPQAIARVELMISTLPLTVDPVHAMAARYWAARWRVFPDVDAPNRPNADEIVRAEGIRRFQELCRAHPTRFYALLAAARLAELDPPAFAGLGRQHIAHAEDA